MQFQIPRWRNLAVIKNSLISSTTTATHFASFHSTPTSCQKWTNKWKSDIKGGQEPTKNYIRYATRQKRADAKRALKDLLFKSGSSKVQNEERMMRVEMGNCSHAKQEGHSYSSGKKGGSKFSAHHADKIHHKKIRRKLRKKSISEDFDDDPEPIFKATFGNKWYTWTFKSWQESSFQNSTSGFEWRERSSWKNSRAKRWETQSEAESDEDSCAVGSRSDRTILGLPPTGPLKIEDVKNAFRLSALKWHPDKHQGPSQVMAEEKFKVCANAYRSLSSALSPA
ncbi:uncharacterized protein LOC132165514 isoform X1 [Corylus avellana]|uniref:uncharacterized protein LOC132165514 isoform X1 n=1 Tax=Corylus avellana TaxID=13451 RepID=UPI00286C4D1C|nr:uncharacterized protein LOC132165514 isoform X1 [Corylus avellana]